MAVLWNTGIVCGCAVDDGTCYNGEENKEIKKIDFIKDKIQRNKEE